MDNPSSLPTENWWGNVSLHQLNDFWFLPKRIPPINRAVTHFKPISSDIILASFPKTGTTWLKSLLYSITHRSTKNHLSTKSPHELVPFLEFQLFHESSKEHPTTIPSNDDSPRIFATHIPYKFLIETLDSSECRVVYVTRNPKDTVISLWHFMNKWLENKGGPMPIEHMLDKFCLGHVPYGPYYEHVMEYKKLSMDRPKNVYFITFEELMEEPKINVKKLAEFLGCPFGEAEEDEVEEIVKSCSFEVLSEHEVNKSGECRINGIPFSSNSFFRNGTSGDHKNYLTNDIIERIDALTREKFHASGFMYGI